ncbi:MAG: ABC transporter substrate-binding protein [Clostridiales bacterium]|nr:ABC transporter substrate-binding protein [Clostridiales bacterium]
MKKVLAIALTAGLCLSLAACGSSSSDADTAADESSAAAETEELSAEPEEEETEEADTEEATDATYVVGICQQMEHEALDAATQGFEDALAEELGDAVTFDEQNAQGDSATCATIVNSFVSNDYDLILANGTTALQAAQAGTDTIPVLGTSITAYDVALGLDDYDGTVGGNISGTSDLAPLDEQANLFAEVLPDAQNIGLLYCTAEANSIYQVDTVEAYLEDMGLTVTQYGFSDSNDLASVVTTACSECDALYIPTDNTAAANTELINNIAEPAGIPIIAGEEGICSGCGIVTLSISYYDLGYTTGQMAAQILTGEADISEMPIEYAPNVTKEYDADRCDTLGITVSDEFTAIESE